MSLVFIFDLFIKSCCIIHCLVYDSFIKRKKQNKPALGGFSLSEMQLLSVMTVTKQEIDHEHAKAEPTPDA